MFAGQPAAVHNPDRYPRYDRTDMDLHTGQSRIAHLHDPLLLITLAATMLTGIGLWYWLPSGYASNITASLLTILNIVLLYPVVEELLFRGLIQAELLRRPKLAVRQFGLSRANLLTSVLFVSLHLIHQPPLWAAAVLVPSLVLGHFRERYNSLLAPVLLHILFNATWLSAGMAAN